jgi:hypothetical protein
VTFPSLVDDEGLLSARMGFLVVPNGLLIDEAGIVRWEKYGGFDAANPADIEVVERFIATGEPGPSPQEDIPYTLAPDHRERLEQLLQQGLAQHEAGDVAAAVATWRQALQIDPMNLTIRKQIWAIEHPEKFYPIIDWDWQKIQLETERAQEIADGICGADGCPIPAR